jgi:hypothetical protein
VATILVERANAMPTRERLANVTAPLSDKKTRAHKRARTHNYNYKLNQFWNFGRKKIMRTNEKKNKKKQEKNNENK